MIKMLSETISEPDTAFTTRVFIIRQRKRNNIVCLATPTLKKKKNTGRSLLGAIRSYQVNKTIMNYNLSTQKKKKTTTVEKHLPSNICP